MANTDTAPSAGPSYRIVEHTADTAIEAWGDTREQLIEQAALGMFDLMYERAEPFPGREVAFSAAAGTDVELLVDVLSELLYLCEVEDTAFGLISVTRAGDRAVEVTAAGRPVDRTRPAGPPIKAVTYHGLALTQDDGWRARVVFDV